MVRMTMHLVSANIQLSVINDHAISYLQISVEFFMPSCENPSGPTSFSSSLHAGIGHLAVADLSRVRRTCCRCALTACHMPLVRDARISSGTVHRRNLGVSHRKEQTT